MDRGQARDRIFRGTWSTVFTAADTNRSPFASPADRPRLVQRLDESSRSSRVAASENSRRRRCPTLRSLLVSLADTVSAIHCIRRLAPSITRARPIIDCTMDRRWIEWSRGVPPSSAFRRREMKVGEPITSGQKRTDPWHKGVGVRPTSWENPPGVLITLACVFAPFSARLNASARYSGNKASQHPHTYYHAVRRNEGKPHSANLSLSRAPHTRINRVSSVPVCTWEMLRQKTRSSSSSAFLFSPSLAAFWRAASRCGSL